MNGILVAGVILFCLCHTFPALGGERRTAIKRRMGEMPYRGSFTLLIVASIILMIYGWRHSVPHTLYTPPEWGKTLTIMLMFISLTLFLASSLKSNLTRLLRHPQLSGLILWTVAHLLSNGDDRALLLFGTFGLWAILEIYLLNKRDGAWQKPDRRPLTTDIKAVLVGGIVSSIVWALHGAISGG